MTANSSNYPWHADVDIIRCQSKNETRTSQKPDTRKAVEPRRDLSFGKIPCDVDKCQKESGVDGLRIDTKTEKHPFSRTPDDWNISCRVKCESGPKSQPDRRMQN